MNLFSNRFDPAGCTTPLGPLFSVGISAALENPNYLLFRHHGQDDNATATLAAYSLLTVLHRAELQPIKMFDLIAEAQHYFSLDPMAFDHQVAPNELLLLIELGRVDAVDRRVTLTRDGRSRLREMSSLYPGLERWPAPRRRRQRRR